MIPGIWNCKLCAFIADGTHPNVLMTHLHDVHGIRRKDGGFQKYLDEYYPLLLCACGCEQVVRLHKREFAFSRFSPGCPGLHRSRSPGCIDFYLHKGMDVDEAVETFRLRQAVIAKGHATEELRDRLSSLNSGDNNPSSVSAIMKRTGKTRREVYEELSAKSSGSNNGFFGKQHADSVLSQNAIKASNRGNKFVTKPEMVMWAWLHALDIEFRFEVVIDRFTVDFLIDNLIIEVYGDYWHKPNIKMGWVDKPIRDNKRAERLRDLGYCIEIFWESELITSPKLSFLRLKDLIEGIK